MIAPAIAGSKTELSQGYEETTRNSSYETKVGARNRWTGESCTMNRNKMGFRAGSLPLLCIIFQ
jgi:hypothetical protein